MKQMLSSLMILGALLWLAPDARGEAAKTLYTCGMHPQVIQDHPGNCPICGMKLTPIRNGAGADAASSSAIAVDAAMMQNMNLRTAEVRRGPLRRTIRTVGNVTHSEAATVAVTTKYRGWVVKLYVDSTGQQVHRGDPLFDIYSPELYSAEAEFLAVSETNAGPDATSLRAAAADKLKFYDIPDAQIASLEKTREVRKTLTVTAPIDGYVMEKMVVQGQMVEPGMKLYELVNHDTVWVLAQVYEQDLPLIRLGQEVLVSVTSLPDAQFRGRTAFVYPTLDEKTRTATVRAEFHNPGHLLKPGMFAKVQIVSELDSSAVLVPDSAVLRSGARNTVFEALDGGKFEARDVTLGVEAENAMIQVISGVNAGERIVTSGQFLLDSESQLREAIEKMRGPTRPAAVTGETTAATNAPTAGSAPERASSQPESGGVVYVCPMSEHVSIIHEHPGNCPVCGMALVPVTPAMLQKLQPDGTVLYYTCPMPAHAGVHEEKPGKCPLCGMTLIPVMRSPTNSVTPKIETPAAAAVAKPEIKQHYYCPMHPEVVTDGPGKCPKCEMDLVPMPDATK